MLIQLEHGGLSNNINRKYSPCRVFVSASLCGSWLDVILSYWQTSYPVEIASFCTLVPACYRDDPAFPTLPPPLMFASVRVRKYLGGARVLTDTAPKQPTLLHLLLVKATHTNTLHRAVCTTHVTTIFS